MTEITITSTVCDYHNEADISVSVVAENNAYKVDIDSKGSASVIPDSDNQDNCVEVVERKSNLVIEKPEVQIELTGIPTCFSDAPKDGKQYVRQDGKWIEAIIEVESCESYEGGLFITDVSNTGSGIIANKMYLPDTIPANTVVTEALTDDDTVTIHFIVEGGNTYSPSVEVDNILCQNMTQDPYDIRLFHGSVDLVLPESKEVSVVSSTGRESTVLIRRSPAPPEILSCIIDSIPEGQTAVKLGDVFTVSGIVEMSATHVRVLSYGGCTGSSWVPTVNGLYNIPVITSGLSGDQYIKVEAKNNIGSVGNTYTSDDSIELDQVFPSFLFYGIDYPSSQEAFKNDEVGSIHIEVTNQSSIEYTSPTNEFNILSPSVYNEGKVIEFNNTGGYNDNVNNFRIVAHKAYNGSMAIYSTCIHVADVAPMLTVSQPVSKLLSSPSGNTYLISINSNQNIIGTPLINIPVSGQWSGSFTGYEKRYSCVIKITDGDAIGSAPYLLINSITNEAGIPAINISGNEVVGGFIDRELILAPFSTEVNLDTKVSDTADLSLTWSFKTPMNFKPIGTQAPVANGWTIDGLDRNPTKIIILDSAAAGASSQASSIHISER